jgi:superfamily II DNA or RNA helicase
MNHLYIVSTIDSYINNVKKLISPVSNEHILLIADEAHWLGASETRKNLEGDDFIYSLGLTATPVRYFDDEGTNFLYSFLGDTVYRFSIKEAQDHGFLCKYNYHIKFCNLDKEELQDYLRLTKAISVSYNQDDEERTTTLLNKRARVVKDALSKFEVFDNLLTELGNNIEYSVVYCDEDQIERICRILREHDILFGVFLGVTPDIERQILISKLISGTIDTIVAIKCLNEGVDIPPLKKGFFLSSSGNPKEFIQRRGRLLRTHEGKGVVDMYDFVVAPDPDELDLSDVEKKAHNRILKKELERIGEFNETALNSAVNERELLKKFNILIWEER